METILANLGERAAAWNLLFSATVALSTVVYAVLTWKLVAETRSMRKAQTAPKVAVYYESRDDWMSLLNIVIRNVGMGPAYDIKLSLEPSSDSPGAHLLMTELAARNVFNTGIRFLAPGQQYLSYFTNIAEAAEEKLGARLRVTVQYRTAAGEQQTDQYVLDFAELRGILEVGEPPLTVIARSLDKVAKAAARVTAGDSRLQVDVWTNRDRNRLREQRRTCVDAQRAKKAADAPTNAQVDPRAGGPS